MILGTTPMHRTRRCVSYTASEDQAIVTDDLGFVPDASGAGMEIEIHVASGVIVGGGAGTGRALDARNLSQSNVMLVNKGRIQGGGGAGGRGARGETTPSYYSGGGGGGVGSDGGTGGNNSSHPSIPVTADGADGGTELLGQGAGGTGAGAAGVGNRYATAGSDGGHAIQTDSNTTWRVRNANGEIWAGAGGGGGGGIYAVNPSFPGTPAGGFDGGAGGDVAASGSVGVEPLPGTAYYSHSSLGQIRSMPGGAPGYAFKGIASVEFVDGGSGPELMGAVSI